VKWDRCAVVGLREWGRRLGGVRVRRWQWSGFGSVMGGHGG